jgi:hypothetical protein
MATLANWSEATSHSNLIAPGWRMKRNCGLNAVKALSRSEWSVERNEAMTPEIEKFSSRTITMFEFVQHIDWYSLSQHQAC